MKNLPANATGSMLSSQERVEHREWIGGRIHTLLSHYWRHDDPVELTAAIGQDWADVLEGLPQEYIQRACVAYQRDEPRRKPTPGEIYQRARAYYPKPEIAPVKAMPRDEAERITSEGRKVNPERKAQAEKILAEVLGRAN